jgi:hypothetical protein
MTQPVTYVHADIYKSLQYQQMHASKFKQKNCACVGAVGKCQALTVHGMNSMQCAIVLVNISTK